MIACMEMRLRPARLRPARLRPARLRPARPLRPLRPARPLRPMRPARRAGPTTDKRSLWANVTFVPTTVDQSPKVVGVQRK